MFPNPLKIEPKLPPQPEKSSPKSPKMEPKPSQNGAKILPNRSLRPFEDHPAPKAAKTPLQDTL